MSFLIGDTFSDKISLLFPIAQFPSCGFLLYSIEIFKLFILKTENLGNFIITSDPREKKDRDHSVIPLHIFDL